MPAGTMFSVIDVDVLAAPAASLAAPPDVGVGVGVRLGTAAGGGYRCSR